MSQPLIKNDTYWSDVWNIMMLRPVYRRPVSTPATSALQASAEEASIPSPAAPDLTEPSQETRTSEQHNPPRHAAESPGTERSPIESDKFREDLKAAINYITNNPDSEYVSISTAKGEVRFVHIDEIPDDRLEFMQQYVSPEKRKHLYELIEKRIASLGSLPPTTEQPQDVHDTQTGRLTARGEKEVREADARAGGVIDDLRSKARGLADLVELPLSSEQPRLSDESYKGLTVAQLKHLRSQLVEADARRAQPKPTAEWTSSGDQESWSDESPLPPKEAELFERLVTDIRECFQVTAEGSNERQTLLKALMRAEQQAMFIKGSMEETAHLNAGFQAPASRRDDENR